MPFKVQLVTVLGPKKAQIQISFLTWLLKYSLTLCQCLTFLVGHMRHVSKKQNSQDYVSHYLLGTVACERR